MLAANNKLLLTKIVLQSYEVVVQTFDLKLATVFKVDFHVVKHAKKENTVTVKKNIILHRTGI